MLDAPQVLAAVAAHRVLEERDVQIRGFTIRLPLDLFMVASANPEDYTNRGNIITPLKDRIASQILTHYPADAKTASAITDQESWTDRQTHGVTVLLGDEVKLLVEEIAFVARRSELVDQSSGVSARLAIAARTVGLQLHDHVIVGREGVVSMARRGLLAP